MDTEASRIGKRLTATGASLPTWSARASSTHPWLTIRWETFQVVLLVCLYSGALLVTRIADVPRAFAGLLLVGLPALAVFKPRLAIFLILFCSAVKPMEIFFPSTVYSGISSGVEEPILYIGGVNLNFNAIVASSLLITACCLFLASGSARGVRVVALPFAPFFVVSVMVWILRFPTLQGLRTMTLVLTPVIFAAAVFSVVRNKRDVQHIERAILYAMPLAVVITFVLAAGGLRPAWSEPPLWDVSQVSRFMGADIPPATAWFCIPPMTLALGAVLSGRAGAWKWVIFLTLVIGATVTRAPLAVASILILLTIMELRRQKVVAILAGSMIVILVGVFFWQSIAARNVSGLGNEFINTSGRVALWRAYTQEALAKPWLGHGWGADVFWHEEIANSHMLVPHNDYIRLWFSVGIIGFCCYLYGMSVLGRRCWQAGKRSASRGRRWSALLALLGLGLQGLISNPLGTVLLMIQILSIIVIGIRASELEATGEV